VSDRAATAIALSVLFDTGSVVEVIDRFMLRRERTKTREKLIENATVTELLAI
jgi:hypothetical protein